MISYYRLLGVDPLAPVDEIKKAFRREIARYHPDKVQHLGKEFQDLATVRAAELTQAYQVLSDEKRRTAYDQELHGAMTTPPTDGEQQRTSPTAVGSNAAPPKAGAAVRSGAATVDPDSARAGEQARESYRGDRPGYDEFVGRAALRRFEEAVEAEFDTFRKVSMDGFDAAYVSRTKRGVFRKAVSPARVLAKFVSHVDARAVQEVWSLACKANGEGDAATTVCVFLMGAGRASAHELANAIALERRRQTRGVKAAIVVVPTDVRNWEALIPTDAPPAVKAIIERLRRTR